MTLTNHLLAGAVIAKVLPLPVAIPVAFASHFALDAVPHFGFPNIEVRMKRINLLRAVICLDFCVSVLLSIWLIRSGHIRWFLVGLVAYSPDFLWLYRFPIEEKFGKVRPTKGNRFVQFRRNIQKKYERIWGGIVELVFASVMFWAVRS
jgi:hypothetical protein